MIEIKNINFGYHKEKIFNDLSIKFELSTDKRRYSLIGPNGCGKSTLLKMIAGHLKVDDGEVVLMGKNIKDYSMIEKARELTLIMQNAKFEFPFTCFDVVLMGRYPHKKEFEDFSEEDIEKAMDAIKQADVEYLASHPVTEVSGGEFQRVLLARAIAQEPKIILLDEAFSAMDIKHKKKSLEILTDYAYDNDAYLIMVIHDMNLAYKYSDRVAIMKEGVIIHHGDTANTLSTSSIKEVFDVEVEHFPGKGFLIV